MNRQLTPFECEIANQFAKKIVGNIDQRDFMDGRNTERSSEKLFEDSAKGKKAEIFIYDVLGDNQIQASIDFDIYDKGIGDDGDLVANEKAIDVKASSPRAKCLLVEKKRMDLWEKVGKVPDCLCMVAVNGDFCTYIFGCSFKTFKRDAILLKRGDCIPNTNVPLKADNYVIRRDQCSTNINDLVEFIKND